MGPGHRSQPCGAGVETDAHRTPSLRGHRQGADHGREVVLETDSGGHASRWRGARPRPVSPWPPRCADKDLQHRRQAEVPPLPRQGSDQHLAVFGESLPGTDPTDRGQPLVHYPSADRLGSNEADEASVWGFRLGGTLTAGLALSSGAAAEPMARLPLAESNQRPARARPRRDERPRVVPHKRAWLDEFAEG